MRSFREGAVGLLALATLFCNHAAHAQSAPDPKKQRPAPAEQSPKAAQPTLSDSAELAKITALWDSGKYKECADELRELLSPEAKRPFHDPDVIENARIYFAACLIGQGKPELADEPLRAAILKNPQMRAPDPLVFPPAVIERFLRVRETLVVEIRKADELRVQRARELAAQREKQQRAEQERVRELERLAGTETILIQNRRWIAFIPFGVGQFQNGDRTLGFVFLSTEAALGIAALAALYAQTSITLDVSKTSQPDPDETNNKLDVAHNVLTFSSWAMLAVAAGGIVEAQLSFVPQVRSTKPRPLPQRLRPPPEQSGVELRPLAGATANGFELGLSGRF